MSMELTLPNELGYELIARDAVAAFARRLGMPHDRIDDLKTVLCEACINAIEHGNSLKPDLRVEISCRVDDDRLVIDVCDQGVRPFAPSSEPLSMVEKLAGLGSLRGMGLMLISQLCDESGFVSCDDAGNCFRFAFQRHRAVSLSC
ncbi:ATP-binding protein [Oscillochloris sp. ZM17-4]|uniref:ATP-binding protein n=1 Tax=Oscillochloris sp. ZM17-4 TaxID=2866714 RepID=UPI001C73493A|nr:ATP-binding protein [Oscillochloris sp. ZM17-4]